jgi:hypothetical protein
VFNAEQQLSDGELSNRISWEDTVEPLVDKTIRNIFETVKSAIPLESSHPSGEVMHPNSCINSNYNRLCNYILNLSFKLTLFLGWSLTQPNIAPGKALLGIDIIIEKESSLDNIHTIVPKVLEVQWAPDCEKALKFRPEFWDDILLSLLLEDEESCLVEI